MMMTQYVTAKIDKTLQNSKCLFRGDRDKTMNHIISKYRKLVQKVYKTRLDWVRKVIHRESCKHFKSDHTRKCYKQNPESVVENETHKGL